MHLYTLAGQDIHDLAAQDGFHRTLSTRGFAIGPIITEQTGALNGMDAFFATDRANNVLFVANAESHDSMEPMDLAEPFTVRGDGENTCVGLTLYRH